MHVDIVFSEHWKSNSNLPIKAVSSSLYRTKTTNSITVNKKKRVSNGTAIKHKRNRTNGSNTWNWKKKESTPNWSQSIFNVQIPFSTKLCCRVQFCSSCWFYGKWFFKQQYKWRCMARAPTTCSFQFPASTYRIPPAAARLQRSGRAVQIDYLKYRDFY